MSTTAGSLHIFSQNNIVTHTVGAVRDVCFVNKSILKRLGVWCFLKPTPVASKTKLKTDRGQALNKCQPLSFLLALPTDPCRSPSNKTSPCFRRVGLLTCWIEHRIPFRELKTSPGPVQAVLFLITSSLSNGCTGNKCKPSPVREIVQQRTRAAFSEGLLVLK